MDPDNPIVKLCAAGMQAESEGRHGDAKQSFQAAWDARRDDFEGAIAAHYVARHQETDEATLYWNAEALRLADLVGDDRVAGFYPSLLLNLGHSHEKLGAIELARDLFLRASELLPALPPGPYRDLVSGALDRGLHRIGAPPGSDPVARPSANSSSLR